MGKEAVRIKIVVQYYGHSFRKNGDLDFNVKADYSEIVNTVSMVRMLNQNITVDARIGTKKPAKLGVFTIKQIVFDREGESRIRLNSETDAVDQSKLIELTSSEELIVLRMSAIVETEEIDDDDEEDEDE